MPREAADILRSATTPHPLFLSLGVRGGAAFSERFGLRTGPTGPPGTQSRQFA